RCGGGNAESKSLGYNRSRCSWLLSALISKLRESMGTLINLFLGQWYSKNATVLVSIIPFIFHLRPTAFGSWAHFAFTQKFFMKSPKSPYIF
ncbi:MAG: hypothetical protein K2L18_04205, partial [Acetatifactor sp.]|nr:hypothetical protein [Acetatifactor sp.]